MENYNERKLNLLQNIGKLIKVIDDEVDWYIASFREKDPKRRMLARTFFFEKLKERERLAKEAYVRSK
ncbi:MAG: hypothetical protein ACD_13C00134G0042 [uncultured bacterium]|uniref:Uncharacterized protein n=1 Tax=Candidatus Woesebacteria bacterium GW2011_GWA1_40_43 TaxID=1618553 RepID=A0A0G0SNP4_9BACT|nr:MAG: hypothetical protein ACD_13C00134G0042 [uncultured bacterium]KKR52178.1 MAG: hypothetical protein UT88_C0024G0013 [Candidatus Woesebacteria bacterium GW2011_GWD2_40_19]KKR57623.1 MAG: hypothetical protein UT96_C0016G0008 [Candidatus Woesebacteria bacterium GW2011_GWC2_40_30]KKR64046.1 MAG: hypothetical protein UU02_C0013G0004 [Candidatus Woesebacteria bacterium GW2011_GWA1_40_43]HAU65458.1 hypothetical protein [Candidatus Woesebacteria bacterium]